MNKVSVFIFFLIIASCKSKTYLPIKTNHLSESKQIPISNLKQMIDWEFKDIINDTIVGISLNRAYDNVLNLKKHKIVTVALLDMTVETNHVGLRNYIWINKNEIPNNNLDDDKNGYIDDINGWNFLGDKNKHNVFVNYEYTRILKKYNPIYKEKKIVDIPKKDSINFVIFKLAEKRYKQRLTFADRDLKYIEMVERGKLAAETEVSKYLKSGYSIKSLDSLKKACPDNKELQRMIRRISNFKKNGYSKEYINDYKLKAKERINKLLNLNFLERKIQADNPDNIHDTSYGSPYFNSNTSLLDHGTKMAGIIKKVGLKNEIRVMPLTVSGYGDEHDKDIALAIRYAVDNGAQVINMSFAKEFSLYPEWVLESIKYAEENNVLIVSAAANENQNIDNLNTFWFPNDHAYFNDNEVSNNFIKVGSSGKFFNNNLKSSFSNYGRTEVDLFAPGEDIYTTHPNNSFKVSYGGTSSSTALTAGVAALIYSYYPSLSVSQIKDILIKSSLQLNVLVKTPTKDNLKKLTNFNKLSKSGGVLNIYNAAIFAEKNK